MNRFLSIVASLAFLLAVADDPPQPDSFALEPAVVVEQGTGADGDARQHFVCKGVTELPNQSILQIRFAYGEKAEIEIDFFRVMVAGGNFRVSFPVPGATPFPGAYRFRITFDPAQQYKTVREQTAEVRDPLSWETGASLGSPEELREADHRIRKGLLDDARQLRALLGRILDEFDKADRASWEQKSRRWSEETNTIVRRNAEMTEYRLVGIASTAALSMESFSHLIDATLGECRALLAASPPVPGNRGRLEKIAVAFDRTLNDLRKKILPPTEADEDVRNLSRKTLALYNEMEQWYNDFSAGRLKEPGAEWKERRERWVANLSSLLQEMVELTSDGAAGAMELSNAADLFLGELEKSVAGGDREQPRKSLQALRERLQTMERRDGTEEKR